MFTRMEAFQGMHVLPAKRDTKKSLTTKKCDIQQTKKQTYGQTDNGKSYPFPSNTKRFLMLHVCRISLKQLLDFFF